MTSLILFDEWSKPLNISRKRVHEYWVHYWVFLKKPTLFINHMVIYWWQSKSLASDLSPYILHVTFKPWQDKVGQMRVRGCFIVKLSVTGSASQSLQLVPSDPIWIQPYSQWAATPAGSPNYRKSLANPPARCPAVFTVLVVEAQSVPELPDMSPSWDTERTAWNSGGGGGGQPERVDDPSDIPISERKVQI